MYLCVWCVCVWVCMGVVGVFVCVCEQLYVQVSLCKYVYQFIQFL